MANSISFLVMDSKAIFFGKNCRMSPFMFSLAPRSQEEYGWTLDLSGRSPFILDSVEQCDHLPVIEADSEDSLD